MCPHTNITANAGKKRGEGHYDGQSTKRQKSEHEKIVQKDDSLEKVARIAMLKGRFADTIYKAAVQLNWGDGLKIRQLERDRLKEKARLEAEIKTARKKGEEEKARVEAATKKEKQDLKMRRKRERAALEKMEKTINIEDATDIMRDFEMLIGAGVYNKNHIEF